MKNYYKTTTLRILPIVILSTISILQARESKGPNEPLPHTDEDRHNQRKKVQGTGEEDPEFSRWREHQLKEKARKMCEGLRENSPLGKAYYGATNFNMFWSKKDKEGHVAYPVSFDDDKAPPGQRTFPGIVGSFPKKVVAFDQKMHGEFDGPHQRVLHLYGPKSYGKKTMTQAFEDSKQGIYVRHVKATDLLGEDAYETVQNIRTVFKEARERIQQGDKIVLAFHDMATLNQVQDSTIAGSTIHNPLNALAVEIEKHQEEKGLGVVTTSERITGLTDRFLKGYDTQSLHEMKRPLGNQRCQTLAYNFLKATQGGDYLTRKNMQTWVNDTHGLSYGELTGLVRDVSAYAQMYNDGVITNKEVSEVIKRIVNRKKKLDGDTEFQMPGVATFFLTEAAKECGKTVAANVIIGGALLIWNKYFGGAEVETGGEQGAEK